MDWNDYTNLYNTPLDPQGEQAFQQWAAKQSSTLGRDVLKGDTYDYDLRGWWQQNNGADMKAGHLTDQFKKPNHPTFSDQSQYHGPGAQGGTWAQQGDAWSFTPGQENLRQFSPDEMQDYFKQVEPGNKLVLPAGK